MAQLNPLQALLGGAVGSVAPQAPYGGLLSILLPLLMHHAQSQPVAAPKQSPQAQGPQGVAQGRHGSRGPQAAAQSPAGRRASLPGGQAPSLGQVAGGPKPFDATHPAVARIGALLAARRAMQPSTALVSAGRPNVAPGAPQAAQGHPLTAETDVLKALQSSPFWRAGEYGSPNPMDGGAPNGLTG